MPLKQGSSRETVSQNIREFHHGATYQRTKERFGKERADKQAVALSQARKSRPAWAESLRRASGRK